MLKILAKLSLEKNCLCSQNLCYCAFMGNYHESKSGAPYYQGVMVLFSDQFNAYQHFMMLQ